MIKDSVLAAMHKQVQHELSNHYAYKAVEVYFEARNFHGLAAFMKKQAGGETEHADKLIAYLIDRCAPVALGPIAGPRVEFGSAVEAAESVLELEKKTTGMIHELYRLAEREGDLATVSMLKWFIDEQVEEEKVTQELVDVLRSIGASVGSLYMVDHQWRRRGE